MVDIKTDTSKASAASAPAASIPAATNDDSVTWSLPETMTGKAGPAKAAVGDKPVFAYIAGLPEPQRGIAEVTPVGMGKATRGVELESLDDLDRAQIADWMQQITSVSGIGGTRR